ncbi:hypothetical protein [Vibrio parahaemolyticus]|uniref:hypothetical protein n=1 Tax=Vibrio parahaemolyticus TaxID=670 RepID=UPI00215CCD22|nr:hypothetical protein [Vibrio parahaemolyticus]MCR9865153.1 hypothetical protein [Vibrio parahaemolyticus]
MNNIELFNLATSEIVARCYESFPGRVSFTYQELSDEVSQYYDPNEVNDKAQEIIAICRETTVWLEQAGYLWINRRTYQDSVNVTLSPKAFEALNMMPDSLSGKESIGTVLMKEAKETGKASVLSAVRLFLSEGVKLAL